MAKNKSLTPKSAEEAGALLPDPFLQFSEATDAVRPFNDFEREELLKRTHIVQTKLDFSTEPDRDLMRERLASAVRDPKKVYSQYYHEVWYLLGQHVPTSQHPFLAKEGKLIREECNVFLTDGKRKNNRGVRGADPRITATPTSLLALYDILYDWVRAKQKLPELLINLVRLNTSHNYPAPAGWVAMQKTEDAS